MRRARAWQVAVPVAAVVALGVLLVALVAWAVVPHRSRATAVLTVTPRTAAGADASRLLADRYEQLADAADTLRTVAATLPGDATTDAAPLDGTDLAAATTVRRPGAGSAIEVTVALPDRDTAVRAANAIVAELVDQGAAEDLVDVRPAAEATDAAVVATPSAGRWWTGSMLIALVLAAATAALIDRRSADPAPPRALPVADRAPAALPAPLVDDLPGFRDSPPGSPLLPVPRPSVTPGATRAAATGRALAERDDDGPAAPAPVGTSRVLLALATAALVLIATAVGVAALVEDDPPPDPASSGSAPTRLITPTTSSPPSSSPATPATTSADPSVAVPPSPSPAAGLALTSLPLGSGRAGGPADLRWRGAGAAGGGPHRQLPGAEPDHRRS